MQNTFRVPFLFIGVGILLFIFFNLFALVEPQFYSQDSIRIPYGWSLAHLGVLGWGSMIAMGAIYQLLQVVLQRQVYSEKICYMHFVAYVIGVLGLAHAFYHFDLQLLMGSAISVVIGICLFVINIVITVIQAKKWNSITAAVSISIVALLLTAITGALMGIDFTFAFLGSLHESLLPTHIWLGVIGWFGLLIVGFSFKLLPMFLLAHNYSERMEPWIVGLLTAGMIGMALSLLLGLSTIIMWISLLVVTSGFGLYWYHVEQMNKHRHKASPGAGIVSAIWVVRGTSLFMVLVLLALGAFPHLWQDAFFIRGAFYFFLLLWVNGSILCYMSKIVPFLWWTHKYSSQMGKPGVPALAQLLVEKSFSNILRVLLIAHVLFGITVMFGISYMQFYLQLILSLLSIAYASQIALVFRR